MDNLEIYRAYREKYSEIAQAMVLGEECGELLSAVSKYLRGRSDFDCVIEEMADVMILIEQFILNIADRHDMEYNDVAVMVQKVKREKVMRMEERLDK